MFVANPEEYDLPYWISLIEGNQFLGVCVLSFIQVFDRNPTSTLLDRQKLDYSIQLLSLVSTANTVG